MDIITPKEARSRCLKEYFTGKPCKNGHIAARKISSGNCKECSKDYLYTYFRSEKYKTYEKKRNSSPERIAYIRDYNASDKAKEATKKYSTSAKGIETARKYRQTDKSKACRHAYHRSERYKIADRERSKAPERKRKSLEYGRSEGRKRRVREKYSTDILFRLRTSMRVSLRKCLRGAHTTEKTVDLLGCDFSHFKKYLESQFRDGMSWENYGHHWHLDHIKPISTFDDLTDIEQLRRAQHYTNIQPLLAHENLSKHNNEDFCLDRYKKENPDKYGSDEGTLAT